MPAGVMCSASPKPSDGRLINVKPNHVMKAQSLADDRVVHVKSRTKSGCSERQRLYVGVIPGRLMCGAAWPTGCKAG